MQSGLRQSGSFALERPARQAVLDEISAAVDRHLEVFDRDWLIQVSPSLVDDLYKAASQTLSFDGEIYDYLQAAIKPIIDAFAEHGILVQYLVDNAWPDWEAVAELVGTWFRSAGLGFVCAQELARELVLDAGAEGKAPPEARELPALARQAANEVVSEHQERGGSFIQLEMDVEAESFEQAVSRWGSHGVVTAIRRRSALPRQQNQAQLPRGIRAATLRARRPARLRLGARTSVARDGVWGWRRPLLGLGVIRSRLERVVKKLEEMPPISRPGAGVGDHFPVRDPRSAKNPPPPQKVLDAVLGILRESRRPLEQKQVVRRLEGHPACESLAASSFSPYVSRALGHLNREGRVTCVADDPPQWEIVA